MCCCHQQEWSALYQTSTCKYSATLCLQVYKFMFRRGCIHQFEVSIKCNISDWIIQSVTSTCMHNCCECSPSSTKRANIHDKTHLELDNLLFFMWPAIREADKNHTTGYKSGWNFCIVLSTMKCATYAQSNDQTHCSQKLLSRWMDCKYKVLWWNQTVRLWLYDCMII